MKEIMLPYRIRIARWTNPHTVMMRSWLWRNDGRVAKTIQ